MSVPQIGTIGERLDLALRQGATFGPVTATMRNPDGTPVNLTGCNIRGQIRKSPDSPTATASIAVTSDYNSTGVYVFGLSSEATRLIPAGNDPSQSSSLYVWDLELEDSMGRVIPLYWGTVRVRSEVTRG